MTQRPSPVCPSYPIARLRRGTGTPGVCVVSLLAVALGSLDWPGRMSPAQAQVAQPSTAPLPPRRPLSLPATPAPETSDAPVQTDPATIGPPQEGPTATRAQLRACSVEWRKMKKSGDAYGVIWRDFARTCIPRQEP